MEEDGGVRMGVGLRKRVWLTGVSGRVGGVVSEEFWMVGIMARAKGCVGSTGGVGAWGRALCK